MSGKCTVCENKVYLSLVNSVTIQVATQGQVNRLFNEENFDGSCPSDINLDHEGAPRVSLPTDCDDRAVHRRTEAEEICKTTTAMLGTQTILNSECGGGELGNSCRYGIPKKERIYGRNVRN